jgi:hypothetical protein
VHVTGLEKGTANGYAGRRVMRRSEKRNYKRLPIKLDLSCRKIDSAADKFYTGCTINVSPGGLYFETATDTFKPDNLVEIKLSIPPTAGLLEFGGRFSAIARILRADSICDSKIDSDLSPDRYGVALEFCRPPKLCT